MTSRYNQTKQEAARHSELLRAMLKLPENKVSELVGTRAYHTKLTVILACLRLLNSYVLIVNEMVSMNEKVRCRTEEHS